MRRCLTLLVVLVVIGTSCGSGSGSSGDGRARAVGAPTAAGVSAGIDSPPPARTDVQRILAGQHTDELSLESSLQLFAVAFGPLPGVTVPRGPAGPLPSGTLAVEAVAAHWAELTDAQRAAVTALSGEDPAAGGTHGRSARRVEPPPDGPGAEVFRPSLDESARLLAERLGPLGGPQPVHVQLTVHVPDPAHRLARADAWSTTLSGDLCRITVNPTQLRDLRGPSLVLTHELFHCYQMNWRDRRRGQPLWSREGLANWVAAATVAGRGGSDEHVLTPWYSEFQSTPRTALSDRSYDAVGFFSLVDRSAPDLMSRVQEITRADSTDVAYAATVAGSGDVVEHWGPRQFDLAAWGSDWDLTGPEVPDLDVPEPRGDYGVLGNGAADSIDSDPLATRRGGISVRSEIVEVEVGPGTGGIVRHGGRDDRVAAIGGQWCTGSTCVCPPDTAQAGRHFPRLADADRMSIAIAGGTSAGHVSMAGRSLRDACGEQPQCYVGRFRMQPPSSAVFTTRSGGGGATLEVAADGTFTIDLSTMAEWVATPTVDPTMEEHVRFGGTVTGHLDLPATRTDAAGLDRWDPAAVTGQVAAYLNGNLVMTMDAETARQFGQAAFGNPSGSWSVTPCTATGFSFTNSGSTFVWQPE